MEEIIKKEKDAVQTVGKLPIPEKMLEPGEGEIFYKVEIKDVIDYRGIKFSLEISLPFRYNII